MAVTDRDLEESFIPIDMQTKEAVHLDLPSMDGFVHGEGLLYEHYRALPCPIGKEDPFDVRKVHEDHSGCSNGFIYEFAGLMVCTSTGNSKSFQNLDMGLVTGSTLQVTIPRYYEDKPEKEVVIAIFDRLFLKEFKAKVVSAQLFEHNVSGMDRLKYSVLEVEHLIDSHGKRYHQGQEFVVAGGQLVWNGPNQPGMNPATGKGEVCSIRYLYTPFWYCHTILHEIRVVRSGPDSVRAPMTALIQREYIFEDEQNDPRAPVSPRQATAPRNGSFGQR